MKSLRLIVICFLAAFCASNIHAQGVKIYKKDKTVIEVPYNELDSIVAVEAFEEEMEFVDLGLSVKWASKNVGAKLPEDYGDYFAWAETAPKKEYTDDNCTSSGQKMGDIAGKTEFDAAAAIIGDGARLPTKAELEELLNNCTTEWVTRNGVEGRLDRKSVV